MCHTTLLKQPSLFLTITWNNLEAFLTHSWNPLQNSLKHPWNLYEPSLLNPWNTTETFLKFSKMISTHLWKRLLNHPKTVQKHPWNDISTSLTLPWNMPELSMGHSWNIQTHPLNTLFMPLKHLRFCLPSFESILSPLLPGTIQMFLCRQCKCVK